MTREVQQFQGYRGTYQATNVPPCRLSLDDLRRLSADLASMADEALKRHLETLKQSPELEQEQFTAAKEEALRVGRLKMTIQGAHGEQLVGYADEVLQLDLPEKIDWISFDSAASLKSFNVFPLNRFTLHLDFKKPPSFNFYNPWEQSTPNESRLEVVGSDRTWATAVYESTLKFFRLRGLQRGWLHSELLFNTVHWLIGFPAALWLVYRIDSSVVQVAEMHTALRGALYIYVFSLAVQVFRTVVGTVRSMFPIIEFQESYSVVARTVLGAVVTSVAGSLLYDILRVLVW